MAEAIEKNENQGLDGAVEAAAKPYTFRRLDADDMFLMFKIIKAIGLKEFKTCFEGDALEKLVGTFNNSDATEKENALLSMGAGIALEAADLLIGNLPKCKNEIYQLLAQVSGLPADEVKKDMILFTEMLIDFVNKEEFPAFIKVVSRLFK